MPRYSGYRASHPDLDVRAIPMSDIRGLALADDMPATGPAMDYSGIPSDPLQRSHSQGLLDRETMVLADMGQGREQADMEVSREQQEQILAQLQRLMAHGAVARRTSNAPGSLGSSLQIPALAQPASAQSLDRLSFGAAFRIARASKAKIFEWRGKRYTTRLR